MRTNRGIYHTKLIPNLLKNGELFGTLGKKRYRLYPQNEGVDRNGETDTY